MLNAPVPVLFKVMLSQTSAVLSNLGVLHWKVCLAEVYLLLENMSRNILGPMGCWTMLDCVKIMLL